MLLKKIILEDFRKFRNFSVEFTSGINVVKGLLNETGKSTLLEGLIAALFYDPKSTAKGIRELASWDSEEQYKTFVEFEDKGNSYLLQKDFDKGLIELRNLSVGKRWENFRKVKEKIREFIGTDSEALFRYTSCIRQDEVREVKSGKKELSKSLEEVITGGKEGILASQAIEKLGEKISELRRGLGQPAKYPGQLKRLTNQKEEVQKELERLKGKVSQIETQKMELQKLKGEIKRGEQEYQSKKTLFEKNKKRIDVEDSIRELEERYDSSEKLSEKVNELRGKCDEAEAELKSFEGFKDREELKETEEKLIEIETEKRRINEDVGKRGKEKTEKKEAIKKMTAEIQQIGSIFDSLGFRDEPELQKLREELTRVEGRKETIIEDIEKRERELEGKKEESSKKKKIRYLGAKQNLFLAALILAGSILGAIFFNLSLLSGLIPGLGLLIATMESRRILTRDETEIADLESRIGRMKEVFHRELAPQEKDLLAKAKCERIEEFGENEAKFYCWMKRKREKEKELNIEKTKLSDLEDRLQHMLARFEELSSNERNILAQVKVNTVSEFKEKAKKFSDWVKEKEENENLLRGMLGNRTVAEISQEKREIARELAVERNNLTEELRAIALDPEEYVKLEEKVEDLAKGIEDNKRKKERIEGVIEATKESIEDQIKKEEELEEFEGALKQEQKRLKVYELTKEFIFKARDEALSSIIGILEKEIQKYFEIFTSGKYKQVKVSKSEKGELEFWVYSNEKNNWAKPEELSGGVIDEFYLACRLALVKLIYGEKKFPLILDDPFGNFDENRLTETLNFFKELAKEYQTIIFTLRNAFDDVADNIIPLK